MAPLAIRSGLPILPTPGWLGFLTLEGPEALAREYSSGAFFANPNFLQPTAYICRPIEWLTRERDNHGPLKPDPTTAEAFKQTQPRPLVARTARGTALPFLSKSGGADPNNMQWLPRDQREDTTRRDLG